MSKRRSSWNRFRSSSVGKALLAGALLLAVACFLRFMHGIASLEALAPREAELRQFVSDSPIQAYLLGLAAYTVLAILPGGQIKTLVYGWLFGWIPGTILVSVSSTLGACLSVLLSRYLLFDLTQHFLGPRIHWLQRAIDRKGGEYLFLWRLIPGSPFSPVNWAIGLTPLPLKAVWWATQLGMLPQIIVVCFAGARLPSIQTILDKGWAAFMDPQLFAAALLLALGPLLIRRLVRTWRKQREVPTRPEPAESEAPPANQVDVPAPDAPPLKS